MEDFLLVMIFFILTPLIIGALVRGSKLRERVDRLERELGLLRTHLLRLSERSTIAVAENQPNVAQPAAPPTTTEDESKGAHVPTPAETEARQPQPPSTLGKTQQPLGAKRQPQAPQKQPRRRPAPPPEKARSKVEWEELLGGRILNRIGALALVIGIAFFLKYAFDQNWIAEWMRVAIGALSGIGLLLGGTRFHRRGFAVFAQGLIGAGIAVLYLSVYASFNFYHLIPQLPAFGLMTAVTALAIFQGRRYDSLAVALLGWLGGFITPLLLSTGEVNAVGLFTYIVLLDAGIIILLIRGRKWPVLEPLSMIASYLWFIAWYVDKNGNESFTIALSFVTLFWILFHIADMRRTFVPEGRDSMVQELLAGGNAALHAFFVYIIFDDNHPAWSGIALFIVAGLHLSTVLLAARTPLVSAVAWKRYGITATVMLSLAIAAEFHSFTIVVLWSGLSLVLIRIGTIRRAFHFYASGMILLVVALVLLSALPETFTHIDVQAAGDGEFLIRRALTFAALTFVAITGARLFRPLPERSAQFSRELLLYIAVALPFAFIAVQIHDSLRMLLAAPSARWEYYDYLEMLTLGLAWALYSTLVVWLGLRYRTKAWIYGGLGALTAAIIIGGTAGMVYASSLEFTLLFNYRVLVLVVIVLAIALQMRMIRDKRSPLADIGWAQTLMQSLIVMLIFGLLTSETNEYYERRLDALTSGSDIHSYRSTLDNARQLVLSGLWVLYSTLLMVIGFLRRSRSLRVIAFALFGISILKIFLYDLSFLSTLYRIFSFIGLGLMLLLISYLFQRYKHLLFGIEEPGASPQPNREPDGESGTEEQ